VARSEPKAIQRVLGRPLFSAILSAVPILFLAWHWRDRPLDQDAPQYFALAKSLAAGEGYQNPLSPWPGEETCERMPGWPMLVAGVLWILPQPWETPAVIRYVGGICLVLAGTMMTVLCHRIGIRSSLIAGAAGLGVALSPALVFVAVSGMSEVAFLFLVILGLVLLTSRGMLPYCGAFSLGLAVTIRTNFILAGPLALAAYLLIPTVRQQMKRFQPVGVMVLLVLFALPITAWTIRNARVTGRFPVLAAIEGETFRGSNNPVVARDERYWGSWIMPDEIPGETPKFELARSMSDVELSRHYHEQGVEWIEENPRDFAWLIVGKLVRGFLPIPWNPQTATYVAFAYRGLILLLAAILAARWYRRVSGLYLYFVLGMFLIVLLTTVRYYGNYRFTHCMWEVFLIPLIGRALESEKVTLPRETA
jgi:hypothetical protein